MIQSTVSPDETRALHTVTGPFGTEEIVRAIINARTTDLNLVVWDLRRAEIKLDKDQLVSTVTVTVPTHERRQHLMMFVRDENMAVLGREVLSRANPPWTWRVSADHEEAEAYIALSFPPTV